jgi:ribosome-associated protein
VPLSLISLEVERILRLCRRELTIDYVRAAGPGGQNVNKVATVAQLRFDVRHSKALPDAAKQRMKRLAGSRMTASGILIIEARRHRSQEQNRQDALARFESLVSKSSEEPKHRRKTKPSAASREKRLQSKKKRGEIKRTRQLHSTE